MKVLVIGDGAREDSIVGKCLENPNVDRVLVWPGNAGIWGRAERVIVSASAPIDDPVQWVNERLAQIAQECHVDLTIVGSRQSLVNGIVDEFRKQGLKIFGPTKAASQIEDKEFMKNLARQNGVPTAEFRIFKDSQELAEFLHETFGRWPRYVLKNPKSLDGHSVFIINRPYEVQRFANIYFSKPDRVLLIENYISGEERSVFVFADKGRFRPFAIAADWKPLFEGNLGPNGGSQGSAFPAPTSLAEEEAIYTRIIAPVVSAMPDYTGLIFAGVKLTDRGPVLLELNAGFGDSETQVILARLKSDFVSNIEAAVDGRLDDIDLRWSDDVAVAINIVPWGYPDAALSGFKVEGIEDAEKVPETDVWFSGVEGSRQNGFTNLPRRVLCIVGKGSNFKIARFRAEQAAKCIRFPGMHYRRDIAKEFE